jgi:hypothetical protein
MGGYLHTLIQGSALLDLNTDIAITPPGYEDIYYEYVFNTPNPLTSGFVGVGMPLVTESDAEGGFVAFGLKVESTVDFLFRYTDSESRYLQKSLIRAMHFCAGTALEPKILAFPLFIPRGGVILFDITANQSGEVGDGTFQIVLVGSKRYKL